MKHIYNHHGSVVSTQQNIDESLVSIDTTTTANNALLTSIDAVVASKPGIVLGFSTTTPLANGISYVSSVIDLTSYQQVQTNVLSSHDGVMTFDFYNDAGGTDLIRTLTLAYAAADGYRLLSAPCFTSYVQYTFLNNSGSLQTDFLYETKLLLTAVSGQILNLEDTISGKMVSNLTRSVVVAKDSLGDYVNVQADIDGALKVSSGIESPFGEKLTLGYTPIVQSSHFYGISDNNQLYVEFTATNGTITSSSTGNSISLNISTDIGSYAIIRSKRVLKYRHGLSNILRVGGQFDTGVASSLQFMGAGNAGSDLYFAMNGTTFGIRRSYGGLLEVRKLTITGASTATETATVTLNGVAYSVDLTNAGGDTSFTAHEVEIGTYGGLWTVEHIGDDIFFIGGSVGARSGTYSFSSGTAVGSFVQTIAGAALTTEFVAQADWNGNSSLITTLDPTSYNNLYEIDYSWFGSSNIQFKVYNNLTSQFEVVHTMRFANASADYSLSSPNLYMQRGIASLGSTTAMNLLSTGSFGATIGSYDVQRFPRSATATSKSISSNTETVILTLANRLQINGYANQSEILLDLVSITADGNRPIILKIIKNPATLSANSTTDYTDFSYAQEQQELLLYDTTTDTYTGGEIIIETIIPKNGGLTIDLKDRDIFMSRDDVIIFTAESTATNTTDCSVSVLNDL